MKKRYICLALPVVLTLILSSCGSNSLKLYKVYHANPILPEWDMIYGAVRYNRASREYMMWEDFIKLEEELSDREFKLENETVKLSYSYTFIPDNSEVVLHSFVCEDNYVVVRYRADNGNLAYIDAGNVKCNVTESPITDENILKTDAVKFASAYVDGLEKYQPVVYTAIPANNRAGCEIFEGFEPASEYPDKDIFYFVGFYLYINGVPSGDYVEIEIGSNGIFKSLEINCIGEYDGFKDCTFDLEKCDKMVSEETENICDVENEWVVYTGYRVYKKRLQTVEDKLCVFYFIQPEFGVKPGQPQLGDEAFFMEIVLFVPVCEI